MSCPTDHVTPKIPNNASKEDTSSETSTSDLCKSPTLLTSTSTNDKKMYPWDWPKPGPIDLQLHDLPHLSSSVEWWYLNAHLDVATKKDDEKHPGVSLFASFFRSYTEHDTANNEYIFGHSVQWALMDHKTKKYYNVSLVDPRSPKMFLRAIEENPDLMKDERLKKATVEMLKKGVVPYPDRLLKKDPKILGQNLTRLPDQKDTKVAKELFQKAQDELEKKNKKGCCCFRKSSVLNAVAPTGIPRLTLEYDENTFTKNKDGSYELVLKDDEVHQVQVKLRFVPKTQAIRNGFDGIIDGGAEIPDFFYYSLPHCTVTGSVTLPDVEEDNRNDAKIQRKNFFIKDGEDRAENDKKIPVETFTSKVTGTGWYDHQFGCTAPEDNNHKNTEASSGDMKLNVGQKSPSYTWVSLQLDNGCQLTCAEFFIHDDQNMETWVNDKPRYYLIVVDNKGQRHQLDASEFTFGSTGENWVSMRTFRDYPTNWKLAVPSMDIDIQLEAAFHQQEFATVISKSPFWEGCVKVTGVYGKGKSITGKGVVERSGFCPNETMTMEHFFKAVSRETLKSVQKILPFQPEGEKLNELVSHKDNSHYTQHMDSQQYSKALVEPIRAVLDRGGKSWRSYAALACCDMVGGNSQHAQNWLALPELMHVGSLIVDDVEDKSTVRRGGPCSHLLYGEDVAINAGTMCYFLGQIAIYEGDGDAQQKVDIYNLYFEAMRAAHSGQAMDIHGLDYMMPEVVENGGDLCRQRVIAIHRLKSAVPASSMAGMGCKLGGGSKHQSKGLSNYFEALGIAFQIVDDVLNLRGFLDGLKTRGEDITAGKVTYPVAKAMSRLEKADRAKLWEIVSSKPEDIETIKEAISLIDKVDAITDSYQEAKDMMEVAWRQLDPLIVDSMVKLNLRAFGWYVLDRTY